MAKVIANGEITPEIVVYKLSNKENYKPELSDQICVIQLSYVKIIYYYTIHYFENMTNMNIFIQGFKAITHIFLFLLMYTKHLEMTIYHCQTAIFYYIEYISQITDKDDNMFFNLTLRDAIVYIYTKTIYDLDEPHRQKIVMNSSENALLSKTSDFVYTYGKIINIIIYGTEFTSKAPADKKEFLKKTRSDVEHFIINDYKNDPSGGSIISKMAQLLIKCENNKQHAHIIFSTPVLDK